MVVDFISLFRFIFIAYFVENAPGLSALQWISPNSGSPGSVLYRCLHSNVTLSWSYVTNDNESVLATFWYSKTNGTLAHRLGKGFSTMSKRLTYDDDTGLTLSGLTSKDTGFYGMSVMLADWQGFESPQVELVVVEPAIVDGNDLIVLAQSADSPLTAGNGSCQPALQLRCGKMLDIGTPPASVVWTTPENAQLASTGFHDGYFLLDLPPHPKGGNYTCMLTPHPEALPCMETRTSGFDTAILPSTMSASLLVETADTRVEELAMTVARLQNELKIVQTDRLASHDDTSLLHKNNLTEALSSLHSSVENITADVDTHGSKVELCLRGLSELQTTVQTELQSLKSTTDALRLDLEEERRAGSEQKAIIAVQAKDIADLQNGLASVLVRLARMEEWSHRAEEVHKGLTSKTELLHQETKEVESSLRQAVSATESRLEAASTDFKMSIDSLMVNTTTRLNHLYNITDILQYKLTEVNAKALSQEVTDLKNKLASAQAQATNVIPRVSALETGLKATAGNMSGLALNTEAAIRSLEAACNRIDDLNTSSISFKQILSEFSTDMNELRHGAELRENQSKSLTQEMTSLQKTVTAVESQNRNLTLRLSVLETGVATTLGNVSRLAWDTQTAGVNLRHFVTVTNRSLEAATSRLDKLNNGSRALEATVSLLKTQYGNLSQKVLTLANQAQLTSLQSNVSGSQDRLSALTLRVTSLESAVQNVSFLNNEIRLVNGTTRREGRVEIRVGVQWGTICDDGWDNADAVVVCNMLGFLQPGAEARPSAAFGQGTGPIVMDDVNCGGHEFDIRTCQATNYNKHNCGHSEDAGVVCVG